MGKIDALHSPFFLTFIFFGGGGEVWHLVPDVYLRYQISMKFLIFSTRYELFQGKKCSLLEGGHFFNKLLDTNTSLLEKRLKL